MSFFTFLFQLTIVPKTVCGRENRTRAGAEDLWAILPRFIVIRDGKSCQNNTSQLRSQYYASSLFFCPAFDNDFLLSTLTGLRELSPKQLRIASVNFDSYLASLWPQKSENTKCRSYDTHAKHIIITFLFQISVLNILMQAIWNKRRLRYSLSLKVKNFFSFSTLYCFFKKRERIIMNTTLHRYWSK